MKALVTFNISVLILLVGLFTPSIAQVSDYRLVKQFESKYASIENEISTANNAFTMDSLEQELEMLEREYTPYEELLAHALYPATFETKVTSLKKYIQSTSQYLHLIESKDERLTRLGSDLSNYKQEITFLKVRSDSLLTAIKNSELSEKRLSELVQNYRKSVEDRDALILGMIDSLVVSYEGMSSLTSSDIAKNRESGTISISDNPLALIEQILEQNIEYASKQQLALSVEDYLRMYAVQYHFNTSWNQIKDEIIQVYGGNDKEEWSTSIDSKMKDWRMLSSHKLWNAMNDYLAFSSIEVEVFDNRDSFFAALDSFVKEATSESKKEVITSDGYATFQQFELFWSNKIKNEWNGLIQDSDLLTIAQIASIDDQMGAWEQESRPIHPLFLVLFVLTLLSITAYILVLVKAKKA